MMKKKIGKMKQGLLLLRLSFEFKGMNENGRQQERKGFSVRWPIF